MWTAPLVITTKEGVSPLGEKAWGQKKITGKGYACIEPLKSSLILDWKASR